MQSTLTLFFLQSLTLPFPAHLALFFPSTRRSLHGMVRKIEFIKLVVEKKGQFYIFESLLIVMGIDIGKDYWKNRDALIEEFREGNLRVISLPSSNNNCYFCF